MEYSSLLFIYVFFPVSLGVYYVTPKKLREAVLLLLSAVFCGLFGLRYLAMLAVYILLNYGLALAAGHLRSRKKAAAYFPFAAGVTFDIFALFAFRTEHFSWLYSALGLHRGFFAVGISLFTLSALGYLVDVYDGRIKAEKNIVRYSLFIMMFPRLLMGPVLRYDAFTRIMNNRRTDSHELGTGLTLFIKGLAKKVIAADTLYALYSAVHTVDKGSLSAVSAWLGAVSYILCLYFTLSGVADMGAGIGSCFGCRFPQSFSYPMFSSRIRFFAAKWHIQVIHWFRSYITKPFASHIKSKLIRKFIFIGAWTIAGFWYGFSAGGAVFGALMGTAIVVENRLRKSKMLKATGIIYTLIAVTVLSVFLAEGSLTGSARYLFAMIGGNRLLTNSMTLYLLRSYLVVLLISMYASTDLFRNMLVRSKRRVLRRIFSAATPAVMLVLLALCTALISADGSSAMQLLRL